MNLQRCHVLDPACKFWTNTLLLLADNSLRGRCRLDSQLGPPQQTGKWPVQKLKLKQQTQESPSKLRRGAESSLRMAKLLRRRLLQKQPGLLKSLLHQ